ncbi:hypothetical protein ORI89_09410 [Sphingobacterium sp. UT-1RO-CII-1]|uniref:hypothetical protein n=1 Tax=Sphingobacterium sp. UT-1RO-CII-1 TaxID=2995225 RepID=UPI00227A263A|nr:hypothetical protein [Sphingobacterium sp. UT-1RO-CII-1]MCY4779869.1 hypothetical protein [Sphingobacterium sp. UT-1RO-CII-1]
MKKLNLEQMESQSGQSNAQAVVCGIGLGLLFTPATFFVGAAVSTLACLVSDSGSNR